MAVLASPRTAWMERAGTPRPDFVLIGSLITLAALGVVMVYSASAPRLEAVGVESGFEMRRQILFAAFGAVTGALQEVPDLAVETVTSSCCGMAGSFGYGRETYASSMQMAELSLLPAVRALEADCLMVADGISCRQQIAHGAGRSAYHAVRLLDAAIGGGDLD